MARTDPRFLLTAAAAAVAVACAGRSGATAPITPAGVIVAIQLDRTDVEGELVAVTDSGFVLIRGAQLAYVPFVAVRVSRLGLGEPVFLAKPRPRVVLPVTPDLVASPPRLKELRLMSRYPAGMSPAVRAALLAAHGQSTPEVVQH